jgi:hypothetical protein
MPGVFAGVVDVLLGRGCDQRIHPFSCGLIGAVVEVAVHVEDDPYRDVADRVGDDLEVLILNDEKYHLRAWGRTGPEVNIEAAAARGGLDAVTRYGSALVVYGIGEAIPATASAEVTRMGLCTLATAP